MGIDLKKGQKIELSKASPGSGLNEIKVGLAWDEAKGKGFFGKLTRQAIDCDASVLLLDKNGKLQSGNDIVYFRRLRSDCGAIIHQGDNLTGAGSGDDEVINVNLNQVGSHIARILFVVDIFQAKSKNQHFGMIENAYIRVVNRVNNEEIIKFNLTDGYSGFTNLFVGELIKENGQWSFRAIGDGSNFDGLLEIERHYS